MVIYKGVIVEEGLAEEVYEHPAHPYTKLLLEAAIGGDTMDAGAQSASTNLDAGSGERCVFYERCPKRREACAHAALAPEAVHLSKTHWARCIQ